MGKVFKKLDIISRLNDEEMKAVNEGFPERYIALTFLRFDEEGNCYCFNEAPYDEMCPIVEDALQDLKDNDMFYPSRLEDKHFYSYRVSYRLDKNWENTFVEKITMFKQARCKKYRKKNKREMIPLIRLLKDL